MHYLDLNMYLHDVTYLNCNLYLLQMTFLINFISNFEMVLHNSYILFTQIHSGRFIDIFK